MTTPTKSVRDMTDAEYRTARAALKAGRIPVMTKAENAATALRGLGPADLAELRKNHGYDVTNLEKPA